MHDAELQFLMAGVIALLIVASIIGWIASRNTRSQAKRETVLNLNSRIRAWWVMAAIFGLALATGDLGAVVLFAFISFMALREFLTLTPTRYGDHRALFWAFFVITPLQFILLAVDWYGMFSIFIPVYVFLILPIRAAAAGDIEKFLERSAKIQWGLMICVYCCSHAPAIVTLLKIPGYEGQNAKLLFYFVLICELSDVLQYVFGKTLGRHPVAPAVSPKKTWEGLIGGVIATVLIGAGLWWATPFTPLQAAGLCVAITLLGFGGGLVMSAIKRDYGVKDWGTAIEGHGGVLDRIDSLCFAAPVFFHLVRYYYSAN
ncbi:MAG: phosphatidate cytidylyltransferase [Planctomycetes bacterium]|nr:phosphatidate cytidylyltransferase [Planctomycetota bacterium]